MTVPLSIKWLPRPAAKYPGCYPIGYENILVDKLGTENFIHLFGGMSKRGHRVDLNKDVNPDTIADVHDLPFEDDSFDGGAADPPYTEEFARTLYNCDYPKWSVWTKELVRVVKPGGKIAIMHNYIVPKLSGCDYNEIFVALNRIKQYPKIVTIFTKELRLG